MKLKHTPCVKFSILLLWLLCGCSCFEFASIIAQADSKIINTVTRYKFSYDRTQNDNVLPTAYNSVAITSSDTVTVTFPNTYTLSSVTCSVSVNGGTPFTPSTCTISGFKVVATGIVTSNTFVASLVLWVSNIINPSPAITTDYFYGTIGSDTTGPGYFASSLQLDPGTFLNCYITFSPTTVNSTADAILTLVPKNAIGSAGSVKVQFPAARRWTNDISITNMLPIATSMSCSNKSANVKSTFQCIGDSQAAVTAANLFDSTVASSFSFSINNFLSPPTEQPTDAITITSYISGYKIDTCTTYVSGLSPKPITGTSIASSTGAAIVVNRQYLLRFTFTLPDTLAQTDTLTLTLPSGSLLSFSASTVSSNFSVLPNTATYDQGTYNINLYMQSQGRTFASGSVLILTVGTYTAPVSIQPTPDFTLAFYRNGFKKMQGTATLTATASTLSGTATMTATAVNAVTSYTFVVTTIDPISSSGKIKIILPNTVSMASASSTCAALSGASGASGLAVSAVCSFNSVQNSVTLSSLNSSSSVIPAQAITIVMSGIRNPGSTSTTGSFTVFTYYRTTDASMVATGSIPGVTATTAIIATDKFLVTSSSSIVNDQSVSYSAQLNVINPIPAGGYFLVYVPPEITVSLASIPGHCSININSTSFVPTVCTAAVGTNGTGTLVNFTNPFASDATATSTFVAKISSVFANPTSTRPTSSFGLYTFHPNGFSIATIETSASVQMTTSDSFQATTIARLSNKNYQLTTYSFTIKQKSPLEASSVLLIGFPSAVVPNAPACSIVTPVSATLVCSYSASSLRIVLPPTAYATATSIQISVTNIRNPPSFVPAGTFTFQTKIPGELYVYSYGILASSLSNSVATPFQSLTYQFTPATYAESVALRIVLDPSESGIIPSSLKLTLANSFTIQTLTCISFIDFVGSCSVVAANTIQVTGTFTSAPMTFSVSGIVSPISAVSDFSSLVSFDSGGYRLDESTTAIKFAVLCTLPCKTCDTVNTSACSSCYTNTQVSTSVYYDSVLRGCYQQCVDGKYENTTSFLCLNCDPNCLTCDNLPTLCTTCNAATSFKFLLINTTLGTQRCVASCPATLYPDSSQNPTTCKSCVSPCKQCTTATVCSSCLSSYFFYQGQCQTTCPASIAIENSNTNNCDPCNANCLTCVNTTTTCTSCNETLLLYLGQCRVSCPSPLVPQNGTCGPCDTSCKTCAGNKFNCTSCDTSSALAYLHNNLCLSQCPETYYKNLGAGLCSLCSSVPNLNCNNCSSVSTCLSCNLGYVLHQQSCLNYVPTGFVNISGVAVACTPDCATCSISATNCTSCTSLNFYNFQCLSNCPAGFVALSKVCQACLSPCRTCHVAVDTCTSCLTTLSPSVFLSNFQCTENCPNGMYPTLTNYTCLPCVSPCQYCTSLALCTTCLNGFFLSGTSCSTTCPSGYTGINRVCQVCLGNCATCSGSTTQCTSCKPDTYFMAVNSSCVTSCGTGLFIDYLTRACVTCTPPCKTCTNTSDTCLSCNTGILYNSQCLSQCPQKYFVQSNQCNLCSANCSSCISLVNCTGCAQNYVLYNGFCIVSCPLTHSVIVSSVCTKCSTVSCHKCTSADFCTECQSDFSLLNGACLGVCPSGFETNGTHCIDTNQQVLTTSASFPVPFSISTVIIIIACLMSKLQFQNTFMAGAIYSLIGIVEAGALGYFLYLYYNQFFVSTPLPFIVGGAAIAYLFLLNLLATIAQNCIICYDKHFKAWFTTRPHRINCVVVNIFSTLINHKFRNILFSKLFNFDIFTAQLQSTSKFKVMNVFSFLSLLHSGAAIFAAAVAVTSAEAFSQLFYACIDVIVATGINCIVAFFTIMKPQDFFYERTADGFELKKRINIDDDFYQSKIEPEGKAGQEEEGFTTNIYRVQAGTGFTTNELLKIRDTSDYGEQDYSFGSLVQKNVEQVSVQAVEQLGQQQQEYQEQFNIPLGNTANKSGFLTKESRLSNAQISIQSSPMLPKGTEQRHYNGDAARQRQHEPQRTVFYKQHPSLAKASLDQSKKIKSIEEDRKKIFDSSSQQSKQYKPESAKNILYKPEPIIKKQTKPEVEKSEPTSEVKDMAVGSLRPVELEPPQKFRKKDEGIQSSALFRNEQQNYRERQAPSKTILQEQESNDPEAFSAKDMGKVLAQDKREELVLPKQDIKAYEKQLEERVRAKDEDLLRIKKQIQAKQKLTKSIKAKGSSQAVEAGKLYKKTSNKKAEPISNNGQESTKKIVEEIEAENDQGQKQTIKVEFNDRVSKQTEEDFMGMMEDHPEELIYEEVDDDKDGKQIFNIELKQTKQQNKGVRVLEPQQQQVSLKESEGEITSANDKSTKLRKGAKRGGDTDGGILINVDEIDKSIDEQSEGIHDKPRQTHINGMFSDISDAMPTNNKKQFGQYSQRAQKQSKPREEEKALLGRKSSPLKANLTLQAQPKKNHNTGSPLKTAVNRFQFENEEKNISESGQDEMQFSRPLRNRLTAPFQTDRQETEFKNSSNISPQKIMVPRTGRYNTINTNSDHKKSHKFDEGERRKIQNKDSALKMEKRQSNLKSKQHQLEFGLADQQEPYIEDDSEYENNYRTGAQHQMLDRPDDDELRKYYEQSAKKKSREKSKKKASEAQLETEKIYMQRQELPKKWK